jgi:hypothetical protein
MKKVFFSIAVIFVITVACSLQAWAVVPAPPVNQTIGLPDGVFNDLVEAECRFCHEDPDIVWEGSNIPDRHHLLMYSPIQTGQCSVHNNSCLQDSECLPDICSRTGVPCTVATEASDCPQYENGERCGEHCIGETVAPDKDGDRDGVSDTIYHCLNCHSDDFVVVRDCLQCHLQIPGEASVHHLLATAQGTDSPLGAPGIGDCTPCHGTLVDDIGDGHYKPLYNPSLVTPDPSGGDGLPFNSYENGAGACDYCHDQDTTPPAAPVKIYNNQDTHHNAGVHINEYGESNIDACYWCHLVNISSPSPYRIRVCEGCHGLDSLHNIQADSDGSGDIVVGGELAGYGHVGRDGGPGDSDCWGCHGFDFSGSAVAPGSGPLAPQLFNADASSITAGADRIVNLLGETLTNLMGAVEYVSDITMTGADGKAVTLTPGSISSNQLTVTVPGATAPGNYALRAVKGTAASNPVVISVKPQVAIASSNCNGKKKVLTVSGTGFGEKPANTDAWINLQVDGQTVDILSWSDTEITASVSNCSNNAAITVNGLLGSATSGNSDGGKPDDKPCKGKNCN